MNKIRQNIFPVLAAILWGLAFSAQSDCAASGMQPFSLNMSRSAVAVIVLILVAIIFAKGPKNLYSVLKSEGYLRNLIIGGICCGLALFVATNLQQAAFSDETESGKVGFITVFYIMLVPVFGLVLKKKAPLNVWISVAIALVGMYFLFIEGTSSLSVNVHDLFAFLCAIVFAIHILVIDHFTAKVNGIHLSLMQFIFVTVASGICAFIFEAPSITVIKSCIWQILYIGVFSSGVAYTLQILAQKDSNPTVVSLLLSLESVFAVIFGAVLLGEVMSLREYIGCAIMFVAVILAQLPERKKTDNAISGDPSL